MLKPSVRDATLADLPRVGPAMAADLCLLGTGKPGQRRRKDPYAQDGRNRVTRLRHDPCVLDTFIAAVHLVHSGVAKPSWAYPAERKRRLGRRAR